MLTRRDYLRNSAMIGTACALPSGLLRAFESGNLITRAIPRTGEELPIVGLGSSATFRTVAQSEDVSALREVIETLIDNRCTVLDTAPAYGAAEEVSGRIARDGGMSDKIFWATKVNVVRRGSGGTDAEPDAKEFVIHGLFRGAP